MIFILGVFELFLTKKAFICPDIFTQQTNCTFFLNNVKHSILPKQSIIKNHQNTNLLSLVITATLQINDQLDIFK